ncbi:MAG: glycosyltransferase family 9 protein [Flavobacteriales bacterium]
MIEKLHRFYPDAAIDMLVRKGNESLLAGHPYLRNVLVWDKKQSKYANLFLLIKRVRNVKYDAVINLQRFAASGFITAFSQATERIGFDKNPLSFLFDKKFPHIIGSKQQPGEHEVQRCLNLIEHLTDTTFQMPQLYPTPGDEEVVRPFINEPFITISPASVWSTKQTPTEVWVDFLNHRNAMLCYLLGAPADVPLCNEIKEKCSGKDITVLAGKLTLLQSAALMKHAAMNYTNDSAPLHLCSAMNAPVTAVFCSTIPEFGFGPLSDNSRVIETSEPLECRPCGLHGYKRCPRGHFKCAQLIIQ